MKRLRDGKDPDPRFSLANERTVLAWVRTASAFIVAGIALESLGSNVEFNMRFLGASALILTGATLPIMAWFHWRATEHALRLERPLPRSISMYLVVISICVTAVLIWIGLFIA